MADCRQCGSYMVVAYDGVRCATCGLPEDAALLRDQRPPPPDDEGELVTPEGQGPLVLTTDGEAGVAGLASVRGSFPVDEAAAALKIESHDNTTPVPGFDKWAGKRGGKRRE